MVPYQIQLQHHLINHHTKPRRFSNQLSSSDNIHAADTIAPHTNINTSTNDQPIYSSSNITDSYINFASAVAVEKTPSCEQTLVFNSVDGIPQE